MSQQLKKWQNSVSPTHYQIGQKFLLLESKSVSKNFSWIIQHVEGSWLPLKLMWVHLIVRYRDTARSFCGNCKINWEVLAQGRGGSQPANGGDQLSQFRAKFTNTQYGPTISEGKTLTSFPLELEILTNWQEFSEKVCWEKIVCFFLNEK